MTEGLDHTSSKSESKKTSSPRNRYAFIGAIIGIAFIRIFRDEGSSFDEVLTGTFLGFLIGFVFLVISALFVHLLLRMALRGAIALITHSSGLSE